MLRFVDLTLMQCREGVPAVYNSEEQPICCVGLANPVSGMFLSAIQHLLVVCTTVEIVLVGVCFSDGTTDGEVISTIPVISTSGRVLLFT